MLSTWLTQTLRIDLPIIGAPMGGRAGGQLAGEVSAAGGLGMLGAARYVDEAWIAAEVERARARSPRLGIGLMSWDLDQDDSMLYAALAHKPDLVSLSFGDPAPYVERVHTAGALVASQINSIDDLAVVEAAGVDVVIAQGAEAGGHTGRVGTLPLLQEVLEATSLPVLAAGGIATGRGLAAVLAAGAQGAVIGTALLGSPETIGPAYARERVIAAKSTDTVYTDVFDKARRQPWPQRWFGRALANDFTQRWHGASADADELERDYDGTNPALGVVYAGEATGLVRTERPAAEIIAEIEAQASRLLARRWVG